MITIQWHLILLLAVALIGFGYVMTLDNTDRMLGSNRMWGCFVYIVLLVIAFLIYGGLVWW